MDGNPIAWLNVLDVPPDRFHRAGELMTGNNAGYPTSKFPSRIRTSFGHNPIAATLTSASSAAGAVVYRALIADHPEPIT